MPIREPIPGRPTPERIKQLKEQFKKIQEQRDKATNELEKQKAQRIIDVVRRTLEKTGYYINSIPKYVPSAETRAIKRDYMFNRVLDEYNHELFDNPYGLQHIIRAMNKSTVKLLDVGAGNGNIAEDLDKEFPNTKENKKIKIKYSGVDINAHNFDSAYRDPRVKQFDLSIDRLPKNTYDIILGVYLTDYVGDKLRVIANLCDALAVNGRLYLKQYIISFLNNKPLNLIQWQQILAKYNPHLTINILPTGTIVIEKITKGTTNFPFNLTTITPNTGRWYDKYSFGDKLTHDTSTTISSYTSKRRD